MGSDSLEYHKVCDVDDVWEGEMELFEVGDNEVLIVHSPGQQIRAFDPTCPHQEISLQMVSLENCILTCSAHLWQFDVITGKGVNQRHRLNQFSPKLEGDSIFVAFPDKDDQANYTRLN